MSDIKDQKKSDIKKVITPSSKYKYENLALEGGSSKGYAYCGAIKKLNDLGILQNLKRFSGSSIGALFASLLACNFTADEIYDMKDKFKFTNPGTCWIIKLYNIINRFGLYSTDDIKKNIMEILSARVDPEITLKDLFLKTDKDLVIVSCNANRKTPIYLHHQSYPDVKLIDAIIASITVPILFKPNKYNFEGTMDYYIDGGTVDNYPIWVFNDLKKLEDGKIYKINPKSKVPPTTLGLKLLCCTEENDPIVYSTRKEINNLNTYILSIIDTLCLQIERADITKSYIEQTIPIHTPYIKITNLCLSQKQKDELVFIGGSSVGKYFSKD